MIHDWNWILHKTVILEKHSDYETSKSTRQLRIEEAKAKNTINGPTHDLTLILLSWRF